MSEEERNTTQNVKQQASFNGSSGCQWSWYLQVDGHGQGLLYWFEGGNIGGDWVIQKKDGYPDFTTCRCDRWPRDMQISRYPWDNHCHTPSSSWFMKRLAGEARIWSHDPGLSTLKQKETVQSRDTNTLQFIEDTARKATTRSSL